MENEEYVRGTACKLGDGYHSVHHLYSAFDGSPQNVVSEQYRVAHVVYSMFLSDTELIALSAGDFLEDSIWNVLDFFMLNDERKHYQFQLDLCTRRETCDGCESTPTDTDFHVVGLVHGMSLDVLLPAADFPDDPQQMTSLLRLAVSDLGHLTEVQRNTKCRVLINSKKVLTDVTLEDVFRLKLAFYSGEHREHEQVISARVRPHGALAQNKALSEVVFLLTFLYTTLHKMELKLQRAGYPLVEGALKDETPWSAVHKNVLNHALDLAAHEKADLFKVYPDLKLLFHPCFDYLKRAVVNGVPVVRCLLESPEAFQPLLRKLNRWMPFQVGSDWWGSTLNLLLEPAGFEDVQNRVVYLIDGVQSKKQPRLTEPFIVLIDLQVAGYFGFVDMAGAVPRPEQAEKTLLLKFKCPQGCSDDDRLWICSTCGAVAKSCRASLVCGCGSKLLEDRMLVCNLPSHVDGGEACVEVESQDGEETGAADHSRGQNDVDEDIVENEENAVPEHEKSDQNLQQQEH